MRNTACLRGSFIYAKKRALFKLLLIIKFGELVQKRHTEVHIRSLKTRVIFENFFLNLVKNFNDDLDDFCEYNFKFGGFGKFLNYITHTHFAISLNCSLPSLFASNTCNCKQKFRRGMSLKI